MLKVYFVTLLLSGGITVLYCQNDFFGLGNGTIIDFFHTDDALYCNIFDASDVKRFDRSKCDSIKVTSAFPAVNGTLVFNGLSEDEAAGALTFFGE